MPIAVAAISSRKRKASVTTRHAPSRAPRSEAALPNPAAMPSPNAAVRTRRSRPSRSITTLPAIAAVATSAAPARTEGLLVTIASGIAPNSAAVDASVKAIASPYAMPPAPRTRANPREASSAKFPGGSASAARSGSAPAQKSIPATKAMAPAAATPPTTVQLTAPTARKAAVSDWFPSKMPASTKGRTAIRFPP